MPNEIHPVWLALLPLAGTLVGAFSGYLATRRLEDRRWQQQRRDQRLQAERQAIEKAFEISRHLTAFFFSAMRRAGETPNAQGDYVAGLSSAFENWSSQMEAAALHLAVLSPELSQPSHAIMQLITSCGKRYWVEGSAAEEAIHGEDYKTALFEVLDALAGWRNALKDRYAHTYH